MQAHGRTTALAPLRYRDYRLLWAGQVSHAGALWMEQVALPLLVLDMTGSAAHLGGVLALRTLPQLVFGLAAGVISDWFDRRRILLIDKSCILIMYVGFAALVVSGGVELWHVYLLGFLRGSLMAFDQPARQSLIPSLVPIEMLTSAVALLSATQNVMRVLGASLGGLAVAAFGNGGAFIAIATIYLGAVTATYLLRVPQQVRPAHRGMSAMGGSFLDGARFAYAHPAIRGVLLLAIVYFTFGMSYMQVFAPLFADRVLDIGSAGFGFMMSVAGIGALASALLIAWRQPTRVGLALPLLVAGFGATLIAFTLSTYLPEHDRLWLVLPFALLAIVGAMQTSYFSLSHATLLHLSPPELRGRVISLLSMDRAMISLGAAAGGFLAEAQGVRAAQIQYALVCIVGGLAVLAFAREFRRSDTLREPGPTLIPAAASDRAQPSATTTLATEEVAASPRAR